MVHIYFFYTYFLHGKLFAADLMQAELHILGLKCGLIEKVQKIWMNDICA